MAEQVGMTEGTKLSFAMAALQRADEEIARLTVQLEASQLLKQPGELVSEIDRLRSENAAKDEEIARLESHAKALEESMALEGEEKDAAQAQLAQARKALREIHECAAMSINAECPFEHLALSGICDKSFPFLEPSEEGVAPQDKNLRQCEAWNKSVSAPSVPAETPKVSMEDLFTTFQCVYDATDAPDIINTADRMAVDAGIRACFRLAGCEDRIEDDK